MRKLGESGQGFRVLVEILIELIDFFSYEGLETLYNIIYAVLFYILAHNIIKNFIQILIPVLFRTLRLKGCSLTLYLLRYFILIITKLHFLFFTPHDQQISYQLMVTSQNVRCDMSDFLHVFVRAFVHGALQPNTDQLIGKTLVMFAVVNKDLDI